LFDDLQITLDNFMMCTILNDFMDSIQTGVKDSLPQIRKGVAVFC